MSLRWVTAAAVAAAAMATTPPAAPAATPPAAFASGNPSVAVIAVRAAQPGTTVEVIGTGWPQGSDVHLQICGDAGKGDSSTCALGSGVDFGSTSDGRFVAHIPIVLPPAPCPCVVEASAGADAAPVDAPITIAGAPTATPSAPPALWRDLSVVVRLERPSWWRISLGLRTTARLRVYIANPNGFAVHGTAVEAGVGHSTHPQGFIAPGSIPTIAGRSYAYDELHVSFGPVAIGTYHVSGRVLTYGNATAFSARTFAAPWALALIVVLMVQTILIVLRNRVRARLAPAHPVATVPIGFIRLGPRAAPPRTA